MEIAISGFGDYRQAVDAALGEMEQGRVLERIFAHDHTVWKPEPDEIANRLGWLRSVESMRESVGEIEEFAAGAAADGIADVLLLGMGGSSLAPEVFSRVFADPRGGTRLAVLDSTHPDAVLAAAESVDPARTLFVVSTKSGGTVETLSFLKYFLGLAREALGAEQAGRRFAAITDPGSKLEAMAGEFGFRKAFLNDPDIGGRYSVLSYFGLVPAALVGVDLGRLLESATEAMRNAEGASDEGNAAALLGAAIGELAKAGRDKLTLISSPAISSFGDWVEQLVAESLGKEGRGVLPVVTETPAEPGAYGADRVFVHLRQEGDETYDEEVAACERAGHPVIRLGLRCRHDLGAQFFLWEMATAIAGHRLGINPFDQPNVEAAKVKAREMVAAYKSEGKLPELTPAIAADGISVVGETRAESPAEALAAFAGQAAPGDYICLQAYVQPDDEATELLLAMGDRLRDRFKTATTVGYGPRFLHSTGQLHKGDAGRGLFVQFTDEPRRDAAIPDEPGGAESSMSFGVLVAAQSLGDRQALLDSGRRVIRFHLGSEVGNGLKMLLESI